jgi:dCMP deaminase
MKFKEVETYMDFARRVAENSHAKRQKVGACLVTPDDVIFIGYNGTPTGFDNTCEDSDGNTLPYVLHAESNAIMKATRAGVSLKDSTLTVTLSPCQPCANLIKQAGIKRVIYDKEYRDTSPIDFLKACGIQVVKEAED